MAAAKRTRHELKDLAEALRARLPELRARYGVRALGIFGSWVTGTPRPDSDLDVLVEFEEQARPSLFDEVHLQDELSDALGLAVDLVERRRLKPYLGKRILAEMVWLTDPGEIQAGIERARARKRGGPVAREYLDFLHDIAESVASVGRLLSGVTFEQFSTNEEKVLAVTKAVENMGEAAKRIPREVQERYPQIPWSDMARTRDRVAHGYFDVDVPLLWEIAANEVPLVGPLVRAAFEAELKARGESGD